MNKIYLTKICIFMILLLSINQTQASENHLDSYENNGEEIQSSIKVDFNDCLSLTRGSTSFDYSEFTADINNGSPNEISVLGRSLYRNNPEVNRHSCAPGIGGTRSMCINVDQNCEFSGSDNTSINIDVEIKPEEGQSVYLTVLSFYELSPERFQWLGGADGPNNFSTKYALRVLKDGQEVYVKDDLESTQEWTQEFFDFSDIDEFHIKEDAVFTFEITPYCPNGNGAEISVWDIDDLEILIFSQEDVDGGTLTGGPFEFCAGDGEADNIGDNDITLSGNSGANSQWVVTDEQGNILGLPPTFSAVDFDGAGAGTCLVWHLSYNGELVGAEMGMNAADLEGCFSLSNSISVVRSAGDDCDDICSAIGGTLAGGPFEFCVGDNEADNLEAGSITLTGNSGANSQWIVTDEDGTILGLPPMPSAVNFDGAGPGTCLVWHLAYEGDIDGLAAGENASDLEGCFSLSNSIAVVRNQPEGGTLTGGPFEFCAGDGEADNIGANEITLTGNSGSNSQWVVTDDQGNILGLPPTFSAVDFDGAGAGTCLVWHLSFDGDLTGAAMGMNANDLEGCFSLSNPITVVRNTGDDCGGGCSVDGGTITGGPFEFCVGDDQADNLAAGSIALSGNSGPNTQWVVTDEDGTILGLPPMPSAVNFDGAGPGTCLIWHLSYDGEITGAEAGMNANEYTRLFLVFLILSQLYVINLMVVTLQVGLLNFVLVMELLIIWIEMI